MPKKITYTGEDYNLHWGFASFEGKVILDIGADRGSTACYFLENGAKKVIAVEGDKKLVSELSVNYGDNPHVICIEKMVLSANDFEGLILTHKPDVVKVDIEGHERHLLGVSTSTIQSIKEWLVETHNDDLFDKFQNLFISLGYNVEVHYRHEQQSPHVRVVWARS